MRPYLVEKLVTYTASANLPPPHTPHGGGLAVIYCSLQYLLVKLESSSKDDKPSSVSTVTACTEISSLDIFSIVDLTGTCLDHRVVRTTK